MKLPITRPHSIWRRLGFLTVALAVLVGWVPRALAAPTNCTSAGGTLTLPAVTLPQNPAVGSTLLSTPATVTVIFNCSNLPYSQPQAPNYYEDSATIQAGNLAPADATDNPNAGNGIMFATNLAGLAVQLTADPVQASDRAWIRGGPGSTRGFEPGVVTAPSSDWQCIQRYWWGCAQYGGIYNGSVSETFKAQLVVTGPVTTGTLNAINLMQFNWYVYGVGPSQGYFATLTLNSTTVKSPACSVVVDPTVVQLPTVLASSFTGPGTTTGQTPFNVRLNCQAGSKLSITLATANQQSGSTSVIAPAAGNGYASNVGVQILDGNGNPITFGKAISEGITSNGTMNLPFNARYYQTAAGVAAGNVTATATYTLTYQ